MRSSWVVAAALIGMVTVAGCTWVTNRAADRNPAPSAYPEPGPTTTTRLSMPPRPRNVPLDKADPCKLLTKKQREQLGLDRPPQPGTDAGMGKAKVCNFRDSAHALNTRIGLVLVQGAGVWLDEVAQADTESIKVAGFPALIVKTSGATKFCNVDIDVAEGQFLDIQFGDAGNVTPPSMDELCRGAQQVAELAMATLLADK